MPPLQETPGLAPSPHQPPVSDDNHRNRSKFGTGTGGSGILKMFKLLPMLSTGCKMDVALLGHPKHATLSDRGAATTVTLFGPRRGRVSLAVQDDPRSPPFFFIELPLPTASLLKEMSSGPVRITLESDARTRKKRLVEEHVWAVYCNGRRSGFTIRRKCSNSSEDERELMRVLRGVSVGAGVLPAQRAGEEGGQITYMRARFERVVGRSKDSEALHMISPDGSAGPPELSIFLVRGKGY